MKTTLTIDAPDHVTPGEPFEGIVRWQLSHAPDAVLLPFPPVDEP